MSSSLTLLPITPSTNTNFDRRIQKIDLEIEKLINDAIQEFAQLPDEIALVSPLRSAVQEKYGDYLCLNIFTIWERLKQEDSLLYRINTPLAIAQALLKIIKNNNLKIGQNCKMLQELSVRRVGYITFKLSMDWMTERIRKMLKDGIDTWAPILRLKSAVLIVPSDEVDMRSLCLRNMLMRILDYVGVAVDRAYRGNTPESSNEVAESFYIKPGAMISKRNKVPVFFGVSFDHAYNDLRTLWTAIHQQRAQWILFITPTRQRNYVKKLFDIAKDEHWVQVGEYPILICCGYRVLSEQDMLSSLSQKFRCHSKFPSLKKLGEAAGYNVSTSFQCAIAYTYLKSYRLAECTFNLDEMLDEEGDSFVYLLKTQAIFSLRDKNVGSGGMVNNTKAFSRKERELAVHLVQFTEVIYTACVKLELHRVCEYLFSLCKKFTSYYEVLMQQDLKVFESKLPLSNATKVVMKKFFDLLGISPDSTELSSSGLDSKTSGLDVIPVFIGDDARSRKKRPAKLNPRFEMFCMNIYIPHFKTFDVFGIVSLIDTDGLLHDKRLPLHRDENGHVSYFFKDWYEPVSICNDGFVFFGNPRPPYSPPFASLLEIYLRLYATNNVNKCVLLCKKHYRIDLSDFWKGEQDYKRATLEHESLVASIDFEYIALRDAIDTSMELSFDSPSPNLEASVKGHIFAYYDGVLDGLEGLKQRCYKALLFQANDLTVKVGPVTMKRSVLAVPANGALIIEALFLDVDTREVILKSKRRLDPKPTGSSKCSLPWRNCFFNLTVKWSRGPKSCYT